MTDHRTRLKISPQLAQELQSDLDEAWANGDATDIMAARTVIRVHAENLLRDYATLSAEIKRLEERYEGIHAKTEG